MMQCYNEMKSNIMRNELRSIRVSGDFILEIIKIYYFVVYIKRRL